MEPFGSLGMILSFSFCCWHTMKNMFLKRWLVEEMFLCHPYGIGAEVGFDFYKYVCPYGHARWRGRGRLSRVKFRSDEIFLVSGQKECTSPRGAA
jgi:hypothetical protein